MKTLSRTETRGKSTKANEILRLQRTNKDIVQLSNKLKSYTCEPCTHSLFESLQSLKEKMESLKDDNDKIISSASQQQNTLEDLVDTVANQLQDFIELRKGVLDYIRQVQTHYV